MIFTISARGKGLSMPVQEYLAKYYSAIPLRSIDSLFGFAKHTTLYGGRFFEGPELSSSDLKSMYRLGIGLRLPLSNHHVSLEEYKKNRYFLNKYHRKKNAVIVTNDDLAKWIKQDFPKYRVEASVIKNINSIKKIEQALELYDTVVLPMYLNEDEEFLRKAPEKKRITLFANGGCAINCPSKLCYPSFSKANKTGDKSLLRCSQPLKFRELHGMQDFDLEFFQTLGFSRFKLLRPRQSNKTGY